MILKLKDFVNIIRTLRFADRQHLVQKTWFQKTKDAINILVCNDLVS